MYALIAELYPICRSITGDGVRETLHVLQKLIPLEVHEVPSGTQVLDWVVPREWNIRDAYIRNAAGETVVDFRDCNLHVLNYSTPIHRRLSLAELKNHLYSIPEQPDLIPYRTSYYVDRWGFCMRHSMLESLAEGEYEVMIDATLAPGHLTYGEYVIPGATEQEVLISCHCCHPSLCNDNLSGIALAAFLAQELAGMPRRYTYRFLFIPGTIGAITWLALNRAKVGNIAHGLVVACVGDAGHMHYKRSRRGNAEIDRAVTHVLRHTNQPCTIADFSPYGYDERQYCSPGFNLAVGSLTRTPHGRFPQYHTSADNLAFMDREALAGSLNTYLDVMNVLEHNRTYVNMNPFGEPQLGRRGLYSSIGGHKDAKAVELALLWVLNQSDGSNTLLDIAERADTDFARIDEACNLLKGTELLTEANAVAGSEARGTQPTKHA
jgi:aminopeptidase-like protein